jgi:hypothetical protein
VNGDVATAKPIAIKKSAPGTNRPNRCRISILNRSMIHFLSREAGPGKRRRFDAALINSSSKASLNLYGSCNGLRGLSTAKMKHRDYNT